MSNQATELLQLNVNGDAIQFPLGTTVSDLVGDLGCGTRGIAVSVNSQLVRKAEWPVTILSEGDRVEVVHAVAGG